MKKILAVSGGVDSMAMLYLMKDDPNIVVAHFNHGTRSSSDTDELFCSCQAAVHNRPFYSQKVTLGDHASEESARKARYAFLENLAHELGGEIYTAHHLDDLLESITINILRGTGWRGLTPLSRNRHPLIEKSWYKSDILNYAAEHNIPFRHDPTNTEDIYLRNRLRAEFTKGSDPFVNESMVSLWTKQQSIRKEIDEIIATLLPDDNTYERAWFKDMPDAVATEIIRAGLVIANIKVTRPQITDFLHAIRTYAPAKKFNLPNNHLVKFTKTHYAI